MPPPSKEAAKLLNKYGEDAKVLAGGHSLIPLMRLRLAQPKALVDINGIKDLDYIKEDGSKLRFGALTRHVTIEHSAVVKDKLPILAEVASRNRRQPGPQHGHDGRGGGARGCRGRLSDHRPDARRRDRDQPAARSPPRISSKTCSRPRSALDEIVIEVVFPVANGPHKYIKFRRRLFDWAIVGAAAQKMNGGWRIGLTNVGPTPVRAKAVEDALQKGAKPEEAAQHASDGLNPSSDLRANPEYKKHLARVLTKRAIEQAK